MTDTQWPRFEVFEQEKVSQPHQHAGSVHAPDAELALLNARDVFARRPNCVNLWVVPAVSIWAKTAQELAELESAAGQMQAEDQTFPEPYYIFQKLDQRGTYVEAGSVEARSPLQALRQARQTLLEPNPLAWWIFPARLITRTEPADVDSMFKPAAAKIFRDQSHYPVASLMRQVREGLELE